MTTLPHIASRVEAAVEAYISVRDFADRQEWKEKFQGELENAINEYRRVWNENGGRFTALHPTLVALSIVLFCDEDLGGINRSHPGRHEHEYYNSYIEFPADLSDLLPPSADRWWESLAEAARIVQAAKAAQTAQAAEVACAAQAAEVACAAQAAKAARAAQASETSPPAPVLMPRKVKSVRLLVSARRPQPEEKESSEDLPMAVDKEPEDSQSRGRPGSAKGAATTRKWKGSSAALRGALKRRAQLRQHPEPAEQSSGRSSADLDPVKQDSGRTPVIECTRCMKAGDVCIVLPDSPCKQCKTKKLRCSLMPLNPRTGKTDRRQMSEAELLDFCVKQAKESSTQAKKGKQRARDSPEVGESESSGPAPSLLATLAGLGTLTLDSGGSSVANTPADSPATLPQPPLPERAAPAPPSGPKTLHPAKPSAGVTLEVPGTSKLLNPAPQQVTRSRSDTLPPSDGASNTARIAALENKQDEIEKQMRDFDRRLKQLGG